MDAREAFLATAEVAVEWIGDQDLLSNWDQYSAVREMTVGDLVTHTARALTTVERYLEAEIPTLHNGGPLDEPMDAAGYFLSIVGLGNDPATETNRLIRERAHAASHSGAPAVLADMDRCIHDLRQRLAEEPPDRSIAALGRRVMPLDDYLVTRITELIVHTDDIAVSLRSTPPYFPDEAKAMVVEALFEMARRRHGDTAVIIGMTRRERDDVQALRVL